MDEVVTVTASDVKPVRKGSRWWVAENAAMVVVSTGAMLLLAGISTTHTCGSTRSYRVQYEKREEEARQAVLQADAEGAEGAERPSGGPSSDEGEQ